MVCALGVARPEVRRDPRRGRGRRATGLPSPGGRGEDRGRGGAQRRFVTTRSGLSGREEQANGAARGVGAGAGARRGREGGYEGEARHILRALGGDVVASFIPSSSPMFAPSGSSRVFGEESDRALRAPGAENRTTGIWLRR